MLLNDLIKATVRFITFLPRSYIRQMFLVSISSNSTTCHKFNYITYSYCEKKIILEGIRGISEI